MRPRISVLLVEDDDQAFVATQALLAAQGREYRLIRARTFTEGLARLMDVEIELCLLDDSLGDRSGSEFLAQARELGVEVPIVLLVDQAGGVTDVEALRSGAADHLIKGSIDAESLARAMRCAAERGRTLAALRRGSRELALARDQGLAASRAKSGYLSDLGRECQGPLTAIVAGCDELLRLAGAAATARIEAMRDAGVRLHELLGAAQRLGECERAAPTPELRRVELGPFIAEVSAAIAPLLAHNENVFHLSCAADIGDLVTDPGQLRGALLNLLGNMCKSMRRGCIEMTVLRSVAADGEAWIEAVIRPNGLAMSVAEVELLFVGSSPGGFGVTGIRGVCRALGGDLLVEALRSQQPVLRVCLPDRGVRPDDSDLHATAGAYSVHGA